MALGSLLSGLGPATSNVLQALAPRQELQGYAPADIQQIQTSVPQVAPQQPQAQAPARPRRSILQTVGQISDVLASVGGATPMYQSGLDAQQAREMEMAKVDTERLGAAMQGAQALMQSGAEEAQVLSALPQLMKQAGVADERAAEIISQVQQNPQLIRGIMGTSGIENGDPKFGMNVQYARDPSTGQTRAYVINGQTGRPQWLDLEGSAPALRTTPTNLGGRTAFVDPLSAQEIGTMDNTVRPDTVANNEVRFDIAQLNAENQRVMNQARIEGQQTLARLRESGAVSEENLGKTENALGMIDQLEGIYRQMHERGEVVSAGNPTILNVWNRVMSSGAGQMVGGAIGSERQAAFDKVESIRPALLLAVSQATGLKSQQLNSNQELQTYMKTLSNPTASYEANVFALEGIRRFISAHAGAAPAPASRPSTGAPRAGNSGRPSNVRRQPRANSGAAPTVVNW